MPSKPLFTFLCVLKATTSVAFAFAHPLYVRLGLRLFLRPLLPTDFLFCSFSKFVRVFGDSAGILL